MGKWWDAKKAEKKEAAMVAASRKDAERLVAVAILRDEIMTSEFARGGHKILRERMNPTNAPGDIEGFKTSTGRFVNRREAQDIALDAGQLDRPQTRELLSSDIDW